jgi:hypothetical protein
MHARQPPRTALADEDVGGSELPVARLAAVRGFLIMDANHDGAITEHTHLVSRQTSAVVTKSPLL